MSTRTIQYPFAMVVSFRNNGGAGAPPDRSKSPAPRGACIVIASLPVSRQGSEVQAASRSAARVAKPQPVSRLPPATRSQVRRDGTCASRDHSGSGATLSPMTPAVHVRAPGGARLATLLHRAHPMDRAKTTSLQVLRDEVLQRAFDRRD